MPTPPQLRRTVNIKREQLNQEIVAFLADLRDAGSEDVKESAQKLYKLLIQPFEAELGELKIDTIIYAPDMQDLLDYPLLSPKSKKLPVSSPIPPPSPKPNLANKSPKPKLIPIRFCIWLPTVSYQ